MELLTFRLLYAHNNTREDIERLISNAYKHRFELIGDRIRAFQGHSGRAQAMIDPNEHLARASPDDPHWKDSMLHGSPAESGAKVFGQVVIAELRTERMFILLE